MSTDGDKRPRFSADRNTLLFRALPPQPKLSVADRRELRQFARELSRNVSEGAAFTCLISDDRELQRLNSTFLGHDYPTDVLSFPNPGGHSELGEVAISLERANAQAAEHGHSYLDELRILMLHGVLHLTGFNHEQDRGEMARAERKWRTHFALPSSLIARSKTTRVGVAR